MRVYEWENQRDLCKGRWYLNLLLWPSCLWLTSFSHGTIHPRCQIYLCWIHILGLIENNMVHAGLPITKYIWKNMVRKMRTERKKTMRKEIFCMYPNWLLVVTFFRNVNVLSKSWMETHHDLCRMIGISILPHEITRPHHLGIYSIYEFGDLNKYGSWRRRHQHTIPDRGAGPRLPLYCMQDFSYNSLFCITFRNMLGCPGPWLNASCFLLEHNSNHDLIASRRGTRNFTCRHCHPDVYIAIPITMLKTKWNQKSITVCPKTN